MLLTKEVEVVPHGRSVKYYREKGYNVKSGVPLIVKVEDLSPCSTVLVETSCDYCGKLRQPVKFVNYNKQTKGGMLKCCCSECAPLKQAELMMEKYGYKSPLQVPEIKEKFIKTNQERYGANSPAGNKDVREKQKKTLLKKYGVDSPLLSQEIQNKIKQTNLQRYGVENPLLNDEIRAKAKQTVIDRYGVENVLFNDDIRAKRDVVLMEKFGTLYPLQNEECYEKLKQTNMKRYGVENVSQNTDIRRKIEETCLDRYGFRCSLQNDAVKEKAIATNINKYGVESILMLPEFHKHSREVDMERYGVHHHLQNPDILAKQKETFYKNGTCPTSVQQIYICDLYNGDMNYSVEYYNADIYLSDDNLLIEYDGGGHDLCVKLGRLTADEFKRKEIIRSSVIKRAGYNQMRIISTKDLLPPDDILLQMLDDTRSYFKTYPNHSWIEYDIDNGNVRNAENKDGEPYDFGELRRISKGDVEAA